MHFCPDEAAALATVVTAGGFTLARPAFVIHAGLAYCADIETLDVELVGSETLVARQKSINQVMVTVESSRGIFAGTDKDHLFEHKQRSTEPYDETLPLLTDKITIKTASSWNQGGRVFIRQRDPLPLSILNITPDVEIGG
jgi:hypothetical protein